MSWAMVASAAIGTVKAAAYSAAGSALTSALTSSGGGGGTGGTVKIDPIDIEKVLKSTAKGFEEATPAMIRAEEAMRPAMQRQALEDARTALMGADPALREERDIAEAAVKALEVGLSKATAEIRAKESEIESTTFNVEDQKEEWEKTRILYQDELKATDKLQTEYEDYTSDFGKLKDFKNKYYPLVEMSGLQRGKLKKSTKGIFATDITRLEKLDANWKTALADALVIEEKLGESYADAGKRYDWLETQAEEAGFKDATSYLDDLEKNYTEGIGTLDDEIAAQPEDVDAYEPYIRAEKAFNENKRVELGELANQIENLKKTGQFSDENYEALKGEFEDTAAAVLEGSPGILDLAEYSVTRQAGVGERLKEAALKNEFRIMQELAPKLVEMYRETNLPAAALANLVKEQADLMIKEPNRSFSDQQVALTELRKNLGLSPDKKALETKVADAVSTFIDQKSLGSPQIQTDLSAKVGSLMSGPSAGEAEKALYGAAFDEQGARRGPSLEAQKLSTFGQGQLASELAARGPSAAETALLAAGGAAPGGAAQAEELSKFGIDQLAATARPAGAAEKALLAAAQRPTEATGLAQFGADQLAATGRTASPVETALGTAAADRLGFEQRLAGMGETDIRTAAQALLGQAAGGPSAVQQNVQAQALLDIAEGVRGASSTEQALRQAAETG